MTLSGLVLAGGRSRRMGADKALLVVDGERLVDRAARVLAGVCDEVMVAAGPLRPLDVPETRPVADAQEGGGPLSGLVGGLRAARNDLVAVLAVDHLDADPAVLRALAAVWQGEAAVVPEVDGRLQPLHAVWARHAAGPLQERLAGGDRSLLGAVAALDVRVAGRDVWAALDPSGRFAGNANAPADLPRPTPGSGRAGTRSGP